MGFVFFRDLQPTSGWLLSHRRFDFQRAFYKIPAEYAATNGGDECDAGVREMQFLPSFSRSPAF